MKDNAESIRDAPPAGQPEKAATGDGDGEPQGSSEDATPATTDQLPYYPVRFSMMSPYKMTSFTGDIPDFKIELDRPCWCDERYLTLPRAIAQIPGDPALAKLVRRELADLFHESTFEMVRINHEHFNRYWRAIPLLGLMTEFAHRELPTTARPPLEVEEYFNKHCAVYFQCTKDEKTWGWEYWSQVFGRYVFRHWLQMHDGRPPFQRHHFLAKAIMFNVGEKRAFIPADLLYVRVFHKSLCDSVAAHEDRIVCYNTGRKRIQVAHDWEKDYYLRWPDHVPCPAEGPLSYRQHGLRLGHLFRALFMVVDCTRPEDVAVSWSAPGKEWHFADYGIEPPPKPENSPSWGYHDRLEERKDWRASRHQVLLVRTGDDSHLSTPVSFQPLFDSHRVLPMRECDPYGSYQDAVRVRLDHALEFIEDLVRREEAALPHVFQATEAVKKELDELCDQWIAKVWKHAAEVGFDNNGFTWQATRRALARLNGEAFDKDQVTPDWASVGRWLPGF